MILLCTRRALALGAGVAVLGLAGFWITWAPQAVLAADALLVALVWLDARWAPSPARDDRPPAPARGSAAWWLRFVLLGLSCLIGVLIVIAAGGLPAPWWVLPLALAAAALLARSLGTVLDRRRAGADVVAERDAASAYSIGHAATVVYRWRNAAPRTARLRVREVRPELLGGLQPPRLLTVAAGSVAR